ncbi:uncharacterized protein METZ01_LOCUS444460 [marine metagenome]|uniref:Uncharacterized protein n=1 Tax=marine metagenome TaxID=408172 RepID=A0A382Z7Y6_9ZZZZ
MGAMYNECVPTLNHRVASSTTYRIIATTEVEIFRHNHQLPGDLEWVPKNSVKRILF